MGAPSDDAYRLHETAERWQHFAAQQQELAIQLRAWANRQHESVSTWVEAEGGQLTVEARRIEDDLRALSTQVLSLEKEALDLMARAIADETRALRQE